MTCGSTNFFSHWPETDKAENCKFIFTGVIFRQSNGLFGSAEQTGSVGEELRQLGAKHYVLQEFRPQGCSDEAVSSTHSNQELLGDVLCNRIGAMFNSFSVRRV
jgi:hypothetical protein